MRIESEKLFSKTDRKTLPTAHRLNQSPTPLPPPGPAALPGPVCSRHRDPSGDAASHGPLSLSPSLLPQQFRAGYNPLRCFFRDPYQGDPVPELHERVESRLGEKQRQGISISSVRRQLNNLSPIFGAAAHLRSMLFFRAP